MKKIFLLFFIFSFLKGFSQTGIDVLHYRFNIELNDTNDAIRGEAAIKVKFVDATDKLSFDLKSPVNPAGIGMTEDGKGMRVSEVTGPNVKRTLQAYTTITIQLSKKFSAGDTATFIIPYSGIPSDGLIISKNKYGKRTFFADNWPNRGHNWLPCKDDPADKASVEFIVTAPQHYQVVANGVQMEETNLTGNKKKTHWKEDTPISTKVMVIGVADFAVNLSGMVNDCIPVYSWVYPEDRDKGFYDYAMATEILPWFIKNVGPYGYKKLANVQSKTTFGGLENANTIFYAENSVTGNRAKETLIIHEIAHQWFGNMATEKKFAHLWLSEGFATYMTILYMEQKYGKDTAIAMLKEDRAQVAAFAHRSKQPVVDHTTNYMELLNENSYQKGGWVLHMLRSQLGDSLFWNGIRKYYATYAGKTADTEDFQKIMEEVSGTNLDQFFKQWLYAPGIPNLDISWTYLKDEKKVAITIEQLQSLPFSFPLDISINPGSTSARVEKLEIKQKNETFYLPFETVVTSIHADQGTSLLFNLAAVHNR